MSNKNLNPTNFTEHSSSNSEHRNPDWKTDSSTPMLKLPVSEHGDVDIVGGVPKDLVHVKQPRVGLTCKRLGIPYAKALVGWEQVKKKNYPMHSGIVILAADHTRLQAALTEKNSKRQKKVDRLPVLAALFTLNRRAKRCRDVAQTYYQSGMHGLAGKMKREKERIYYLKGQVLYHMVECGVLTAGQFHNFEFGNWAEVLEGEGYRFHRPCPPQVLADESQHLDSIEPKPKETKEPALEVAYEVAERFLQSKPRVSVYEWPNKVRRRRHERWGDDDDSDDNEDGWYDEENDDQCW